MIGSRLIFTLAACILGLPGQVHAQSVDADQLCPRLQTSGLYYAYMGSDGQVVTRLVGSGKLHYSVNSRFIYSPPGPPPGDGDEGVWHIRTQTTAAAAPRANRVYVYRPPILSRCSGGNPLLSFNRDDRFVEINRYVDYHAADGSREQERQLHDYFHFKMQNPENGDCAKGIRTDDASLLGHYVFQTVRREDTPTDYEVASTIAPPAHAAPKPELTSRYQGLSSEFAYRETSGMACVSFSPPLPTGPVRRTGWFSDAESNAVEAATVWKPRTTSVVLKRVRGRRVVELVNQVISWNGQ
ncbi:hypothetical protein [Bradyrhizobium sp. USDA 4506]